MIRFSKEHRMQRFFLFFLFLLLLNTVFFIQELIHYFDKLDWYVWSLVSI